MQLLAAFALFAGVALFDQATQAPVSKPDPDAPMRNEVLQASNEFLDAFVRRDIAALDRLEADDFLLIQRTPQAVVIVGKGSQLEGMSKSPTLTQKIHRNPETLRVRIYGNVAVVVGVAEFQRQEAGGKTVVTRSMMTEIWSKENQRWRLHHLQPTDLPIRAEPKSK